MNINGAMHGPTCSCSICRSEELNEPTEPTQDQIYRRRIRHLEGELAEVLKDRKVQGWTEYRRMQAKVEALTEFAEFCDFHHHSCRGRLGQHFECNCGYSAKRNELRNTLAGLDGFEPPKESKL